MKAITICQPYPRLILIGEKPVENRTWYTPYRGDLLIHAGKSREWLGEHDERAAIEAGDPLVFGAIVGRCRLVACLRVEDIMAGKHDQRFPQLRGRAHCHGPWCWVLDEHVRVLLDRLDRCGGLWRVALGYAVLTDPKNKVIDPSLSYLELHPRLRDGLEALEHPFTFWPKRLWKGIWDILVDGWNL